MNKQIKFKALVLILIGIGFSLILVMPGVMAAEQSYCCEKTVEGFWCQNEPLEKCNQSLATSPTSCESTGYCKEGCCFNKNDGTCSKNTPQKICEDDGGIWTSEADCSIPQCELGCCLIGDQAAFVSQTRCSHLASVYGLFVEYRTDITSELSCIASATADVEGACVFKEGLVNNCERATKSQCADINNASFYEGYLCTHSALDTICGESEMTTCVEGEDPVYFLDTCGNLANVYDYNKRERSMDADYWNFIIDPTSSCGVGQSNAGDQFCGNCNYYDGSTCKQYDRTIDGLSPALGDNICRDLSCVWDGEIYQHGETWCANSLGASEIVYGIENPFNSETENIPGSRYFRLVCYNGEVTIEPCSDFRQEICLEQRTTVDSLPRGIFSSANCIVNKWQDCVAQEDEDDCENTDVRDCQWINVRGGQCVPKYAPGLNFWTDNADIENQCEIGNARCTVEYERGADILGITLHGSNWEIVKNEKCDPKEGGQKFINWRKNLNDYCRSLGDCGLTTNYLGETSYNDWDDLIKSSSKLDAEELEEYKSEANAEQ